MKTPLDGVWFLKSGPIVDVLFRLNAGLKCVR